MDRVKRLLSAFGVLCFTGTGFMTAPQAAADVPFRNVTIDAGFFGPDKGVGKIDGDDFPDIVVAGGSRICLIEAKNVSAIRW